MSLYLRLSDNYKYGIEPNVNVAVFKISWQRTVSHFINFSNQVEIDLNTKYNTMHITRLSVLNLLAKVVRIFTNSIQNVIRLLRYFRYK